MNMSKLLVGLLLLLVFGASQVFFFVEEGQQAIVTQFGRPVGGAIKSAGLNLKIPFVQNVHYFEKRLLKWDGSPNQIPTRDKKYIWVDTTARWRIVDPLVYLQTVATERGALSRLDDIIDSVVRDLVSSNYLVELIRSADWIFKPEFQNTGGFTQESQDRDEAADQPIRVGRLGMTRQMLASAGELTKRYGIELVDIRIKRINYVDVVRKRVYERMTSERQRIAAQYRAEGEGRKAEILGQMEKDLAKITSQAQRRAQEIRGEADAQVTKIYGQAFNKNPEFYSLIKSLEILQQYPNQETTVILSTDSDLLKYLKTPK